MVESQNSSAAVETQWVEENEPRITLYELIEAIGDELEADEENMITDVVLHLIDSGRIRVPYRIGDWL
jgi:hypothetical protein